MFSQTEIINLVEESIKLALQKFQSGFYPDAEVILEQTIKVVPENLRALQLLGVVKHAQQKYDDGIKHLYHALALEPQNQENYNNLALCYSGMGDYQKSIDLLKKAIEIKPDAPYLHSNLGLQYRHVEDFESAISSLKTALEFKESVTTWNMLGGCYGELLDLNEAEKCFSKALSIDPNFAAAHVDMASVYQMRGEYDKAWPHYEWRYKVYPQLGIWNVIYEPEKKWDGSCLKSKRILIHGEQGHGDFIHFVRYVNLLKEKGAFVILHCDKSLERLFKPIADETFTIDPTGIPPYKDRKFAMPSYDWHCSVISLPYLLRNPKIPQQPYLKVLENANLQRYEQFLKIGIAWSGNPQHPNDRKRSCFLSEFRSIHDCSNVKLFSLVTDTRPRMHRLNHQAIDLAIGCEDMRIVDMSSEINDFYDTATIMNSLDLIITVDTSALHLAGALGKKTYGLIPYSPDWRWGLTGNETVWYPSVKLFRQKTKNNWKEVFSDIKEELNEQRTY